jgi:1-acyl-sn-glycerol-3-phosphate acyltransferase
MEDEASLRLSPAWCFRQRLDALGDPSTRALLRGVLAASAGTIRVEGARRLAAIPDPAIFALTHHNAFEALLAPAALIALRGGRMVRFLVDWMYLEMPFAGRLLRRGQPIAVYRKAARWHWRESVRQQGLQEAPPTDRALASLGRGTSIGIYPEGRRNGDPWRLAPVRRGAALLALRSGAPVIPIGIAFPSRERLGRVPRLGKMILRVGEPLTTTELRVRAGLERAVEPMDTFTQQRIERHLTADLSRALVLSLAQLAEKSTCT